MRRDDGECELRQRVRLPNAGLVGSDRGGAGGVSRRGHVAAGGLVEDWVYALAEYNCLWRHRRGEDVAERMAAFELWAAERQAGPS